MTPNRARRLWIVAALVGFTLALASLFLWRGVEERYLEFASPDQKYTIVVFRRRSLLGSMPGQASDAPGRAVLYDRQGRPLREENVEMVQLVKVLGWEPERVWLQPFGEWTLPK